jgi:serine/threonine protein kinase
MFAWSDDCFVEPTEYVEGGQILEVLLGEHRERALTWKEKSAHYQGSRQRLGACSPERCHPPRRPPTQHRRRPSGVVKMGNFDLAYIPDAPNLNIANLVRDYFDRRYVAPAVWENPRDVVPASDVYSLGLVFYQPITGQPPVHDVDAVLAGKGPAVDAALLVAELSRAGSPNFMSDPAGAEIIGRMCAPERSDRYATLAEAMEDLAICEP